MKQRARPGAFNNFLALLDGFCIDSVGGLNIVHVSSTSDFTANPVRLTDMEVSGFFWCTAPFTPLATSPEALRTETKPGAPIAEVPRGTPWLPPDLIEKCVRAVRADTGRSWRKP